MGGLLLLFLVAAGLQAQPLGEGDRVGAVRFAVAANYGGAHLRLRDFGDRPVVLVFWTTGCKSFEGHFRAVEALQRRFSTRLQLVFVSRESPDSVRRYFLSAGVAPPSVPMVTVPPKLMERLPASGFPYTLWLDRAHRARYLTAHYNLTAAHLEDFLAGRPFDARSYWPADQVEATTGKAIGLAPSFYSHLMPCGGSEDMGPVSGPSSRGRDVVRLSASCVPALYLFGKAYGGEVNLNKPGALVLALKDSARWLLPADSNRWDRWFEANHYSYELVLPERQKGRLKKYMQQDLERYFPLQARMEKRLRPTYVLVRTTSEDHLRTRGGPELDRQQTLRHPTPADSLRPFCNKPFSEWIEKMSVMMGTHYLADSTGYTGNVDITLRACSIMPLNVEELRRDLQRHGLDLLLRKLPQDVLVIREQEE